MPLLVRKIERAKWMQNDIVNGEDASADAITNCMKTKINSLSVWKIDGESDLHEAILAMASQSDHLDTIDIALLDESALESAGLRVVATPGMTPVQRLVNSHRDIADLTYRTLGVMADLIIQCFKEDRVHRYTRGTLRRLLQQAVQQGELILDDLKESVRSKVI